LFFFLIIFYFFYFIYLFFLIIFSNFLFIYLFFSFSSFSFPPFQSHILLRPSRHGCESSSLWRPYRGGDCLRGQLSSLLLCLCGAFLEEKAPSLNQTQANHRTYFLFSIQIQYKFNSNSFHWSLLKKNVHSYFQKKSRQEVLELKASDSSVKPESCSWLNLLLTRLWFEFSEKDSIQKFLRNKVDEELVDVKRTPAGIFLVSDLEWDWGFNFEFSVDLSLSFFLLIKFFSLCNFFLFDFFFFFSQLIEKLGGERCVGGQGASDVLQRGRGLKADLWFWLCKFFAVPFGIK